jgi:hypothetical protein
MAKRSIFLLLLILLLQAAATGTDEQNAAPAATSLQQDPAPQVVPAIEPEQTPKLAVTMDTTFVTKYLWRGYDVLDDHGAFQPSVNADLFGTGFSTSVWGSFALSSGFEDIDELDYTFAYARTFFEDQIYALRLGINYIYYDYPNTTSLLTDAQEIGASAALPNLISLGPVTLAPSYYAGCLLPAKSGSGNVDGGWFHTLAMGCAMDLSRILPGKTTPPGCFGWDITYNDGTFDADHDWSHTSWYVSWTVPVGPLMVTPSLRYQISMDESVNDEDELWGGLSASYSF